MPTWKKSDNTLIRKKWLNAHLHLTLQSQVTKDLKTKEICTAFSLTNNATSKRKTWKFFRENKSRLKKKSKPSNSPNLTDFQCRLLTWWMIEKVPMLDLDSTKRELTNSERPKSKSTSKRLRESCMPCKNRHLLPVISKKDTEELPLELVCTT